MAKVKCPKCFHVNPDGNDHCEHCKAPLPRIRIDAQPAPTPPSPPNPELQFARGQVVAGRYSVLSLIGRGGMGAIYKVHDNVLGEAVALKTLLPQFVRDKMVVERFFNEAKIARRLAHPNIVRVHDIGNAEGSVYISMEYVQGISLRSMLEGLPAGQRLTLNKVLALIDALCAALEYAHQYTIHRDIKPENIMVTADGTVKLMDFGISKLMADTRMTAASVVMGTPFYMSPEQLKNSRDVDARADIYSVGVVLYEALTGNVPTGVPRPASQIASEVPPTMDAIIMKCVSPDPRERYANATELRAALRPIIDLVQSGGDMKRLEAPKPAPAGASLPWRKVAGWVLLLALLGGVVWALLKVEAIRQARALEAAAAVESGEPAPVAAGQVAWDQFASVMDQLDEIATRRASQEHAETFRKARQMWQELRTAGSIATEEQQATARRALQYYLGALIGTQQPDMAFVPESRVESNGKQIAVEPFLIDKREVTNAAWNRFCVDAKGEYFMCLNPPAAEMGDLPITNVSYYDAAAFAAAQEKLLPTDAQWTAAARAGLDSGWEFPWGASFEEGKANVNNPPGAGAAEPVGKRADDHTPRDLWDLAGNVMEWTRTPAPPLPPSTKPDFGVDMLVRGGSFDSAPATLVDAQPVSFGARLPNVGFRCVRELPTDIEAVQEYIRQLGQ